MNYIFEDTIRFDAVDRSLTHIETDDNISLAASVSALLEYFIKNQGAVITRNTLLDDIFKRNELVDSDSNLSQNVSMLRKGFRDLGVGKDILVTKPRVGLLLPDDVKVTSIARQNTHLSPSKKNPFFCMHPLYMMWSLLLIPLLWGLFNVQSFRSSGSSSLPVAETLAGCKVHVLNNAEDARHRATALIHAESFQCDEQDIFYYLENNSVNIPFDSLILWFIVVLLPAWVKSVKIISSGGMMINKKKTISAVIVVLALAILTLVGVRFYSDNITYSCTGQQKIYMKPGEYMDVWIKMNVKDKKSTMLVKGVYHNADGSQSNIYRQGNYQYQLFGNGLIDVTLLSVQQLFKDSSPERLSNYIFGIEPGESRKFRFKEIRDGLMMFGSEYAWFYTCKIDA